MTDPAHTALAGYGVAYARYAPSDHVHFSATGSPAATPDYPQNGAAMLPPYGVYILIGLLIVMAVARLQYVLLNRLRFGETA